MPLQNLNGITPEEVSGKLHVGRNDDPKLGTLGMQELLDAQPNLIRAKFNAAITALNSWIGNILAKDNTTPYTPTADYHPATKKYADDIAHASGAVTPEDIANWDGKADQTYVDSQLSNKANASHLAETMPHSTTENLTYYVKVSGNNNNNGLTSATPFKTIAKAISMLPQNINHTVQIIAEAGTYNEALQISGFRGKGSMSLIGADSLANSENYIINNVNLLRNSITITVQGFRASSGAFGFISNANKYATLKWCSKIFTSTYGIQATASNTVIEECEFSNCVRAIETGYLSTTYSLNNVGTGNTVGLYASTASTIGKSGTQPSATTAETTVTGGEIR